MRERLQPRALPWPLPLRRQGEAGRGCSRLALIRKAPLPNPSGPPAQLACVRWRANQWFANAPPHPLPSQGRGLKLAAWAAPTRSRSRKGGEACFVPHSPFPPLTLDRVVHLVLERRRRREDRGDFLPFPARKSNV